MVHIIVFTFDVIGSDLCWLNDKSTGEIIAHSREITKVPTAITSTSLPTVHTNKVCTNSLTLHQGSIIKVESFVRP